jgi:hypothetical protein
MLSPENPCAMLPIYSYVPILLIFSFNFTLFCNFKKYFVQINGDLVGKNLSKVRRRKRKFERRNLKITNLKQTVLWTRWKLIFLERIIPK